MEGLGIDVRLMFAQIINFGLFFFIFKRFVAPSFYKFLESEKLKEQEKERILSELENKQIDLEKKEKQVIKEAQDKAIVILTEARDEAKKIREQTVAHAKEEVTQLKARLKDQLEEEKHILRQDLKETVLASSTQLVKLVLGDVLDKTTQKKLTESLVKHLGREKLYEN